MSSDKSVHNFLKARDNRQDRLVQLLGRGYLATIFLSLNIAGVDKAPTGAQALFDGMLVDLSKTLVGLVTLEKAVDRLGPYAISALDRDPVEVKMGCIALESRNSWARLIDLDVYSGLGVQIDRASLGFPARICLVCPCPAVECIRLKRHSGEEILVKTHELLDHFSA